MNVMFLLQVFETFGMSPSLDKWFNNGKIRTRLSRLLIEKLILMIRFLTHVVFFIIWYEIS